MRSDDTARKQQSRSAVSGGGCRTTIASERQVLSRPGIYAARLLLRTGLCWTAYTMQAAAQVVVPGINAPPDLPTPTPSIQVPPLTQQGPPPQPTPSPLLQDTFPDRVIACNQMGTAVGLTAGSLDAYTMQCANGN